MSEQEQAVTTPAVVETTQTTATAVGLSAEDLGKVRELVLRAHPDVVPELVRGESVAELIGSVEAAGGAYKQIAERVRADGATVTVETTAVTTPATPPAVPAGGAAVIDPAVATAGLSPTTKIAQALKERRKA